MSAPARKRHEAAIRSMTVGDTDSMSIARRRHAAPQCERLGRTGPCTRALGHDESYGFGGIFSGARQHVHADRVGTVLEVWR